MGLILNSDDRILVVSPHPDDESIGCGGVLSLYKGHCDVLLATDGYNENLDNKAVSEVRVKEFIKATDYLGVCKRIMLHIPEGRITEYFSDFLSVDFCKYKYIFVPNRFEEHKDHSDLFKVINKVLKRQSSNAELLEYEVWTTIRKPNVKIDITDVVEQKKNAILIHESQVEELDYVGMIIGLNTYRGKGHGCNYAETFYSTAVEKRKKLKQRKKRIKALLKRK